ncbi:MAG: hypothetical protein ABIT38_15745, partial [Gemmatimonadaceae bacterium]
RGWRVLPGVSFGPDGDMASLMIANMDPVGRLSVIAQGGYGNRGSWHGGSLSAALRGSRVELETSGWYSENAPSKQVSGSFASLDIDSRYTGGELAARYARDHGTWGYALRAGGSLGQVNGNQLDGAGRAFGLADLRARLSWNVHGFGISPMIFAQGAQGTTGGDSWERTLVTGSLTLGGRKRSVRADGTVGHVTAAGPGDFGREFEQFAVGGSAPPFFDPAVLSQRVALPSVPVGYTAGRNLELYRVSLPLLGVRPFATWVAAGDKIHRYKRIFGVDKSIDVDAIGFARVPATSVRAGVGYSLDEPYNEKMRAYFGVVYRP